MPNDDSSVTRTRRASPNHLNDRPSSEVSDESRSFFSLFNVRICVDGVTETRHGSGHLVLQCDGSNCQEKGTRNSFVSCRSLDDLLSECTYKAVRRKTWNGFGSKTRTNLFTSGNTVKDDSDSVFESHSERQECSESLTQVRRVSPYFQHKQGCNSDSESSKTQSGSSTRKAKVQRVSPYLQASTRKTCSKAQPKVRKVSPYFQGSTVPNQPRDMRQYFKVVKVSRYFHGLSAQVNESQKEIPRRVRKTPLVSPSLSQSQKTDEAYLRKTPDNTWVPPPSPCNLLQEDHWHDPWRVLVICMLLNKTSGAQTRGVISDLFALCPNAKTATKVEEKEIETLIKPLGLQNKRSKMIKRFSLEYLQESWTHVTQLHGVGKYAADAYAIFCNGKWDCEFYGPAGLEELYPQALALYKIAYNHAIKMNNVRNCGFVWKVAGPVLCRFYIEKTEESSLVCPLGVFKVLLG
ncbi:hypothetical protein YC2023_081201 [Brassica napus]